MANDMTGNPWALDTSQSTAVRFPCCITRMEWMGAEAVDDDLTVLDYEGRVIWDLDAIVTGDAHRDQITFDEFYVNGIQLSVIDSGILRVWIK